VENLEEKVFGWPPGPIVGASGALPAKLLGGDQCAPCGCVLPARLEHADGTRCLLGVDPGRQVMRFGCCMKHFQGFVINPCVGDVQLQVQAILQGIGPLNYYIKCVHAVDGDMPLCNHQGLGVVEIYTDNDVELGIQVLKPSPALAATLQLLALACFLSLIQSKGQM
jgi:hypothetical protein